MWSRSTTSEGEVVESVAVMTCPPRPPVDTIDRMPLVIPREHYARWIDPGADVSDLLQPTAMPLVATPVSPFVNSPKNGYARCLEHWSSSHLRSGRCSNRTRPARRMRESGIEATGCRWTCPATRRRGRLRRQLSRLLRRISGPWHGSTKRTTALVPSRPKMPASPSELTAGTLVRVRQRTYLVESVREAAEAATVLILACIDDDAQGQRLSVIWSAEVDGKVIPPGLSVLRADAEPDDPKVFAAYLHALRWGCVTSTDPSLFQSPLRAGIVPKNYQLEPLRKALALPRVNLFIADDVGLGKTIEAGLVLQELLLRQRVQRVVVSAPASVVLQWRDELAQRFGLCLRRHGQRLRQRSSAGAGLWRQPLDDASPLPDQPRTLPRRGLSRRSSRVARVVLAGEHPHPRRSPRRGALVREQVRD